MVEGKKKNISWHTKMTCNSNFIVHKVLLWHSPAYSSMLYVVVCGHRGRVESWPGPVPGKAEVLTAGLSAACSSAEIKNLSSFPLVPSPRLHPVTQIYDCLHKITAVSVLNECESRKCILTIIPTWSWLDAPVSGSLLVRTVVFSFPTLFLVEL